MNPEVVDITDYMFVKGYRVTASIKGAAAGLSSLPSIPKPSLRGGWEGEGGRGGGGGREEGMWRGSLGRRVKLKISSKTL